ncbi:MAG: hypothetical protein ACD_60C00025G0070 [uncultured bacterium]|nr:MAG: hypothetical protein ACD_60C00025G0070 [uncultured bacterium]
MTNSREHILARIRKSLHRGKLTAVDENKLEKEMQKHLPSTLPKHSISTKEELTQLFIDKATQSLAKIIAIESFLSAPSVIDNILKKEKLPLQIRMENDPLLSTLSWSQIEIKKGRAMESDKASLTHSFCGVAETGTLVLLSSEQSPTTLNFLPEIHIVLLSLNKIVGYYENAWDLIRAEKNMPRTVNFITGPSRTADIEQTVQIGIHGPKQLYILLYEE